MVFGNPAKKYHHVGLLPLSSWDVVGTKGLGKLDRRGQPVSGIKARFGVPKHGDGGTRIVSLLFDPRLWTIAEAVREAHRICQRQSRGCKIRDVYEATSQPDHPLPRSRR